MVDQNIGTHKYYMENDLNVSLYNMLDQNVENIYNLYQLLSCRLNCNTFISNNDNFKLFIFLILLHFPFINSSF
jgi:hypothetical protein